jgi:hypothetical protein
VARRRHSGAEHRAVWPHGQSSTICGSVIAPTRTWYREAMAHRSGCVPNLFTRKCCNPGAQPQLQASYLAPGVVSQALKPFRPSGLCGRT